MRHADLHSSNTPPNDDTLVQRAQQIIALESQALAMLSSRIDAHFGRAVRAVLSCPGRVIITGMGKPGFIARKISATLASLGTPSLYLHPAEARHGDLGRVTGEDWVIALSNSGETEEIIQLLSPIKEIGASLMAITGQPESTLARHAEIVLNIGPMTEACPLGLAPTASTTAMLVLGDALAMCVAEAQGIEVETFARFHPGGAIGRSLMKVSEIMRQDPRVPRVEQGSPLGAVISVMTSTPGHPGVAVIVARDNKLAGVFTDGDLRRLIERSSPRLNLDQNIDSIMHVDPLHVRAKALVGEAVGLLRKRRVDQLVVLDTDDKVVGLLDVQDLLAARLLSTEK